MPQNIQTVNQIIHNLTTYANQTESIYPTLTDLKYVFKQVMNTGLTPKSMLVIPFYINEKKHLNVEFEIANFYIECRDDVSAEDKIKFLSEQPYWLDPDSEYRLLAEYITEEDMQRTHFLCHSSDVSAFHEAMQSYLDFLMERGIEQMVNWLERFYEMEPSDFPYGYFCFKITSE